MPCQQEEEYVPLRAPHLQDCAALHAFQQAAESRGANGEMPWWDEASDCSDYAPDPPWVREGEGRGGGCVYLW